jgi:glutaredoxin-related protein
MNYVNYLKIKVKVENVHILESLENLEKLENLENLIKDAP